jgi:hypothetical protein
MTLQDELDALRDKIERGGPRNVPGSALVAMARATRELIATGQADRAMTVTFARAGVPRNVVITVPSFSVAASREGTRPRAPRDTGTTADARSRLRCAGTIGRTKTRLRRRFVGS